MAPSSTPSTPSRRLTRSQTATTVLGKRASLTRSSSVVSNRSVVLMTPESTPKTKRVRKSLEEDDGRANKENIPPEFLPPPSPTPSRLSRRSSFSSDISTISTRSVPVRNTIRRSVTYNAFPSTPSSILSNPSAFTPPPSPPTSVPLYLRVRGLLRATSNSNVSMSMEGREAEHTIIESFLHSLDGESKAEVAESVLYVSGTPGTGKTALVNSIIASTKVADDVKVVFVNCMAITGMDTLWEKLAEDLAVAPTRGRGAAKKVQGKDKVSEIFEKQRGLKCILVLDELDNLAATSSNDLQSLFSLASSYPSILRIMGIANTHTLISTTSMVPSSDAKVKTIHFAPYAPTELLSILNKRFEDLPQDELKKFLPAPTLNLLSKKVSALTGDVRVLFEVLRGAIDIAVSACLETSTVPEKAIVSPAHILSALKAHAPSSSTSKAKAGMTGGSDAGNSDIVNKVRGLGLQQRLALLGIVLASKRATATLPICSSSAFSSVTPPATPTKRSRSPIKRSSSGSSTISAGDSASSSGVDSIQLFSYYSSLPVASDAFTPVSRSEFSDLLGILETTGLVSLSSSSLTHSLKRSSSFAGSMKSNGAGTAQNVSLQAHIREYEVVRGLGIGVEMDNKKSDEDGDALEDGVRAIWSCEMSRIRREAKAKDSLAALEGVEGFEDAVEA